MCSFIIILSLSKDGKRMMHCRQFCGRAFDRKFNRDRREAAHCSRRFDDEEGMISFSNEEKSIEQRSEKYYKDDDEKIS